MYPDHQPARIRRATLGDIDTMADVVLASLSSGPSWRSFVPAGFQKDPTYRQYARDILMKHLSPENFDSLVLVAESPCKGVYTIVSVAVWNTAHSRYHEAWRMSSSTLCEVGDVVSNTSPEAHDSVIDKLNALSAAISFSQKQHFEQFEPYVYLEVIATHPAHRGQGYAKALCAVGVDSAQKRSLAVAALTSSRDYIFFSGMSFRDLGCVTIRGADRPRDDCTLKAMILHPQQPKRRSSVVNSFLSYVSLSSSTQ